MSTDTTPAGTPDLTDPELMALVRANPLTAAMREFDQASRAYVSSYSPVVEARYWAARKKFIRQLAASADLADRLAKAERTIREVSMCRVWKQDQPPHAFVYADDLSHALGLPATREEAEQMRESKP